MRETSSEKTNELNPSDVLRILKWSAYLFLCWFLYWLFGAGYLVAEPWQWADDAIYLRHGQSIFGWLAGNHQQWLGPYDPTLLTKPPGFGIWLAAVHASGMPLRFMEFAVHLLLPFLFLRACRPVAKISFFVFLFVTVLLVALPSFAETGRLSRTNLQATASSACLIAAVGLVLRANAFPRRQLRWGALLGAMFALCYLNREESAWLMPGVVCATAVAGVNSWKNGHGLRAGYGLVACALAAGIPITVVAELNYRNYGERWTCVRRSPSFTRFFRVLTSLEPGSRQRYVPVTAATRLKAYPLSPAFNQLKPFLEGRATDEFACNAGHHILNGKPLGEREFYVSSFEWALRRATSLAGWNKASDAEKLWRNAAAELKSAIRAKKIEAGVSAPGLSAAPMQGDSLRIVASAQKTAINLLTLKMLETIPQGYSSGTPEALFQMSMFTHNMLASSREVDAKIGGLPETRWRDRGRHRVYQFERIAYPLGSLAAIFVILWTIVRGKKRPTLWLSAIASLLLLGSMALFCLLIGALDIVGWPITGWCGPYTNLGFAPLSVLAAFGLVAVEGCLGSERARVPTCEPKSESLEREPQVAGQP